MAPGVGTAAFWGIQAGVTGNIQAVMDGALDGFIEAKLRGQERGK